MGVGVGQGSGGTGSEGVRGPGHGLGQSTNKLQLVASSPLREKIAFTLYFLIFFFHFTASKSIQNRLSNCLNFRRKAS